LRLEMGRLCGLEALVSEIDACSGLSVHPS
jgi:hypothetical protein